MRISWLSAEEIAAARQALTANGASYDDHFAPGFVSPPRPPDTQLLDWEGITEHVARAERVSAVVREHGYEPAMSRFGRSGIAIEAATLAAAAHGAGVIDLEQVLGVLRCEIDTYVFYAPFLELMADLGADQIERMVPEYETFVAAYAKALSAIPHGAKRVGATRDGLAEFYVRAGRLDEAQQLFERRHDEDRNDVAVALSASRAFLQAKSISHAVRWLGEAAARATVLGRAEMATQLRQKQDRIRERLS